MTDEEKAEKWILENWCAKCDLEGCSKTMNSSCFRVHVADYLAGLKAGRKEGYEQGKNNERESQCGKKNYEKDIARLEKENKISEEIIIGEQQEINRLEKELAESKARVENLICNLMDIQNKIDEIVTTPKIMQKEENELLCKLIKKICEYTRSN